MRHTGRKIAIKPREAEERVLIFRSSFTNRSEQTQRGSRKSRTLIDVLPKSASAAKTSAHFHSSAAGRQIIDTKHVCCMAYRARSFSYCFMCRESLMQRSSSGGGGRVSFHLVRDKRWRAAARWLFCMPIALATGESRSHSQSMPACNVYYINSSIISSQRVSSAASDNDLISIIVLKLFAPLPPTTPQKFICTCVCT